MENKTGNCLIGQIDLIDWLIKITTWVVDILQDIVQGGRPKVHQVIKLSNMGG